MTEKQEPKAVLLGGRMVGVITPNEGQMQQIIRIGRSLGRGPDDAPQEFWIKQVGRMGDLIDELIAPADLDVVDQMYAKGLITHADILQAIMTVVRENGGDTEAKTATPAKASPARVRRR